MEMDTIHSWRKDNRRNSYAYSTQMHQRFNKNKRHEVKAIHNIYKQYKTIQQTLFTILNNNVSLFYDTLQQQCHVFMTHAHTPLPLEHDTFKLRSSHKLPTAKD